MATFKEITELTQATEVSGAEKLPISSTQYLSINQIIGAGGKSSFINEYINGELEYITPGGIVTEEIYSKIVTINLPIVVDETANVIITNERIGNNIYLVIDNVTVSAGFDITTNLLNDFYTFKIINTNNINYVQATCTAVPSVTTLYAYVKVSYIKYHGQRITFDITCASAADATDLELTIPVLKFNKTLLASLTGDDANVSHFCVCHNLINNRPTSYLGNYWCLHKNQQDAGDLPSTITEALGYTLCSTDGCGNDRRFAITCAIWPNVKNANDPTVCLMDGTQSIDPTADNQYRFANPSLQWLDLEEMLEFGDSIVQHDVDVEDATSSTAAEIIAGFNADVAKTIVKLGRGMKMMARPSSYTIYETAFSSYPSYLLNVASNHSAVLPHNSALNLWKLSALREFYETPTDMETVVTTEVAKTAENRKWCHSGIHRATQGAVDLLTWYYTNYGKAGDDSIWFASMDEYYEYWFMRKYAIINKTVNASVASFEIFIPEGQYFYYPELSFVSNKTFVSLSNISDNIVGKSNSNTMININLDASLVTRANKYVSKYELSQNNLDLADAQYFVNQLKDGTVKTGFVTRINAVITSIPVTGIAITTKPTTITDTGQLAVTYTPSNTTQTGVSWSSSNTSVAVISSTGLVTVLAAGSSTFTVTSTSDSTLTDSCSVTCALSVISPTSISLSGSTTGVVNNTIQLTATILPANASSSITWSSSNTSIATVSSSGLVSLVAAGSVVITATSVVDTSISGSTTITVSASGAVTWTAIVALSTAASQTNEHYIRYDAPQGKANKVDGQWNNPYIQTPKDDIDIVNTDNVVVGQLYLNTDGYPLATETTLAGLTVGGTATQPTTSNIPTTGEFEPELIKNYWLPYPNANGKIGCLRFAVPNGTYSVKIYMCTGPNGTPSDANLANCMYKVNSETAVSLTVTPFESATCFVSFSGVVITDQVLDVRCYANATFYNYPGMNMIEIKKTA